MICIISSIGVSVKYASFLGRWWSVTHGVRRRLVVVAKLVATLVVRVVEAKLEPAQLGVKGVAVGVRKPLGVGLGGRRNHHHF
jgi:hypothetical protein